MGIVVELLAVVGIAEEHLAAMGTVAEDNLAVVAVAEDNLGVVAGHILVDLVDYTFIFIMSPQELKFITSPVYST